MNECSKSVSEGGSPTAVQQSAKVERESPLQD